MLPSIDTRPNSTTKSSTQQLKPTLSATKQLNTYNQRKSSYEHEEKQQIDENINSNVLLSPKRTQLLTAYETVMKSALQQKLDTDLLLSTTRDTRTLQRYKQLQSQRGRLSQTAVLHSTETYRSKIEKSQIKNFIHNESVRNAGQNARSNGAADSWQHTLRNHGECYVNIGNMFTSGLSMKIDMLKNDKPVHIIEHSSKQSQQYNESIQQLINENKNELLNVYSSVGCSIERLQIVGTDLFELERVDTPMPETIQDTLDDLVVDSNTLDSNTADNTLIDTANCVQGPSIQLSTSNLTFTGIDRRTTHSTLQQTVQLTNNGSTALYYTWHPTPSNLSNIVKHTIHTQTDIFVPDVVSGVLLPQQLITTTFVFNTNAATTADIYNQQYTLHTTPELQYGITVKQQPIVTCSALLIQNNRKHQLAVNAYKQQLQRSVSTAVAKNIINTLLDTVCIEPIPPKSTHRELFYRNNTDNTKLHYHSDIFDQLCELSNDTYKLHPRPIRYTKQHWHYSCRTLYNAICNINTRHTHCQPELLQRYNHLIQQCYVRPQCNAIRYSALYTLLQHIGSTIERTAYTYKRELGITEPCAAELRQQQANKVNTDTDDSTDLWLTDEQKQAKLAEQQSKLQQQQQAAESDRIQIEQRDVLYQQHSDKLSEHIKQQFLRTFEVFDTVAQPAFTDSPPVTTDNATAQQLQQLQQLHTQNTEYSKRQHVSVTPNGTVETSDNVTIETELELHTRLQQQNSWSYNHDTDTIPKPLSKYNNLLNQSIKCMSSNTSYTVCCTDTHTYYIWLNPTPVVSASEKKTSKNKKELVIQSTVDVTDIPIANRTIAQLCSDQQVHTLPELVSLQAVQLCSTLTHVYILTDTGDIHAYNIQNRTVQTIHQTVWLQQPAITPTIEPVVTEHVPDKVKSPKNQTGKKSAAGTRDTTDITINVPTLTPQRIKQITVTTVQDTDWMVVLTIDNHVYSTQLKSKQIDKTSKSSKSVSSAAPAVLGIGDKLPQSTTADTTQQWYLVNVLNNLNNDSVHSIHSGLQHCIAVTQHGAVYVWGYNDNGELGLGDKKSRSIPTLLDTFGVSITIPTNKRVGTPNRTMSTQPCEAIKKIVCGQSHTIALSQHGNVYVFGCNSDGQFGTGDKVNLDKATLLTSIQHITATPLPVIPVESNNAWGFNEPTETVEPVEPVPQPALHVVDIAASNNTTAILLQQDTSECNTVLPWSELYTFGQGTLQPTNVMKLNGLPIQNVRVGYDNVFVGIQCCTLKDTDIETIATSRGKAVANTIQQIQLTDIDNAANTVLVD